MDNKDSSMENGHASHNNPLALNNSTGENELALPPIIEPKMELLILLLNKVRQKFLRELKQRHMDIMVPFRANHSYS